MAAAAERLGPRPLAARGEHNAHAACGTVCVPAFLHEEFLRQRAPAEAPLKVLDAADGELRAFYREVLGALEASGSAIAVDPPKFWRSKFLQRFGTPATDGRSAALTTAADDKYDSIIRGGKNGEGARGGGR